MNMNKDYEDKLKDLLNAAKAVRENAYAPYSEFRVGAAILAEDGRIYIGCNVENGSYGLSICAEQNALSTMIAAGGRILPLAIAIAGTPGKPCYPCGACRQILSEFNPSVKVVLESGEDLSVRSMEDYLPLRFVLE